MGNVVLFGVGGRRFAIAAGDVERVVPAVEIVPLPLAPAVVAGLVDIHGRLTPVFDLRWRLSGSVSAPSLSAYLIVLYRPGRPMALLVDDITEVCALPEDAFAAIEALVPGAGLLKGAAPAPGGLILIQDPETLFTATESATLEHALAAVARA